MARVHYQVTDIKTYEKDQCLFIKIKIEQIKRNQLLVVRCLFYIVILMNFFGLFRICFKGYTEVGKIVITHV
jgi:hypothetical protein